MQLPSFRENHISQIPALQLLMKLGYQYISPREALEARGERSSNVLLETILKAQLQAINKIEYKEKEFAFSDANIQSAILALRDLPVQDGFIKANETFYELITLGKSLEQTVLGDKKSFSFKYIDWANPQNNVFHVTEEFAVSRSEREDTFRPDIVLFINGIPIVVIECKSPKLKSPIDLAIEQHLRNQQENGIRSLYNYSNVLLGLCVHEAKYATTATKKEFWSVWKEQFRNEDEQSSYLNELQKLKALLLPENEGTVLFQERFKSILNYFNQLEKETQVVTEQDKLLYSICKKDRLLDLMFNFILFDEGVKKITRYQQYFAVKWTLERIGILNQDGKRTGGVIWHTQGSGKSLTMVMLAQMIAMHPAIKNPRIVLVTDRIDLDDQITDTFKKCGKAVLNASTGEKLVELLEGNTDTIITTVINKFQSAVTRSSGVFNSPNIFVLVDESHRTQYGTFNVKMQKTFPKACYIAFTGTPLLKRDKSTAAKFGGIIPGTVYTIADAVADKSVVPLLYEGRHNLMEVNEKPLDTYFNMVSEPMTEYGKSDLKRKFSTLNKVTQSASFIENTAWDIAKHYATNIQGTGFKAQLVAPNKLSAIRYREFFIEIGKTNPALKISVDVVISAPDDREGEDDAFETRDEKVKAFYKSMLDKYGNSEKYEKSIINNFKKQDEPEIIIVVDKLLTGFDAPRNQVLYLTRNLREHTLLQAIARVNRLYPGKDYGYIIDYYGNLENLDAALHTYTALQEFDEDELIGALTSINAEVSKLPQVHSELWDIFKEIRNKYDEGAYEELLADEVKRYQFYEKLSVYLRILKLALSSLEFNTNTPENQIEKYKKDAAFFLGLRVSVKRRFSDELNYKEYEAQVQKLIDKHIVATGDVLKITELVDVFDKEERQKVVEQITGKAAKADHIASRTIKAINIKMNEDPAFYKKLSELIKDTIAAYHQQRISEADYLAKAMDFEDQFFNGKRANVPSKIADNASAISYYNLTLDIINSSPDNAISNALGAMLAFNIDNIIKQNIFYENTPVIDWQKNEDVKGKIRIEIDDYIFDFMRNENLSISYGQIDELIEGCIKVAETKFKN